MKKNMRFLAAMLALSLALVSLCACGKDQKETKRTDDPYHVSIAAFDIMYQWYLDYYAQQFQSNYKYDPNTSDKSQIFPNTGTTYFAAITDEVKTNVEEMYLMYYDALDAGLELDDDEKQSVQSTVDKYKNNMNVFATTVTEDDIKALSEISALAAKYETKLHNEAVFSDDEVEKYYQENRTTYDKFGVYYYGFQYSTDGSTAMTQEQAEANGNALAACKNSNEFCTWLTAYLTAHPPEGATAESIQQTVESCYSNDNSYAEDAYSKWAYDNSRKIGDTYMATDTANHYVNVLMMADLPFRNEETTVNVRHILFSPQVAENATEEESAQALQTAKAKAQEVLAEYQKNPTEDHFAELATAYSADTGTAGNGGLYEGLKSGDTVENFNGWCTNPDRKAGDVDLVQTTYGYHLIYFVGKGNPVWMNTVRSDMKNKVITDRLAQLQKKHKVTFDDDKIEALDR